MKILKTLIVLFIIVSCSVKKTEYQITEFDKVLGAENSKTLNSLVSDFEKDILIKTYPNLNTEKAYKQFLIDVNENKLTFWNKISSENRKKFNDSKLKLEIYEYPDSVWIDGNDIKSRFAFKNDDGTTDYGIGFHSVNLKKNIDSLIEVKYKTPRMNYVGKYMQAINKIKDENDFLKAFYDVKETTGFIHPEIMAGIILKSKPDFSSPITKGLIVMEFGY